MGTASRENVVASSTADDSDAILAAMAWMDRDPGAALDAIKPRATGAVIAPLPSGRPSWAEGEGGEEEGEGGTAVALDVRHTLTERRVAGTPVMRARIFVPTEVCSG